MRVVVTGATGGIGRELVSAFVAAGAEVIAHGRDSDKLEDLAASFPAVATVCGELSTAQGRAEFADALKAAGGVDGLVNNAGTQTPVDARSPGAWSNFESELCLNVHAPIHLIHLLLPALTERRPTAPHAFIVNVTSGLALAPKAASAPYSASKAALRSYSQGLRWQLRDSPVTVIEALPPLVKTAMTEGRNEDAMAPAECARQIVRGVRADKTEIYIGKAKLLRVVMRVSPALGRRIMRDS